MPRRKDSTKTVPLPIGSHDGESSPHLLNLRSPKFEPPRINSGDQAPPSVTLTLEERVAAFDERLKDVPDFLKSSVKSASSSWQKSIGLLLERTAGWAEIAERRLNEQAFFTHKRVRRKLVLPALPFFTARASQFIFIFAIVALITIPLQALLLYRTIQSTQQSLIHNLSKVQSEGRLIQSDLESKNFSALPGHFSSLLNNLTAIRKTTDRLGPLQFILPERFRTSLALLHFGQNALASLTQIANQSQDLTSGRISPGNLINSIHQELGVLRLNLRAKQARPIPKSLADTIDGALSRAHDLSAVISALAGSKEPRNILLVFQNPRELRATGGFAGSFALLTLRDGTVESIEAPEGGTYALQGQLPLQLISPQPLHLINPRFEFQDANWWPNFPTSAGKIAELFQASGGSTIDAVVAMTANVGEELLRLHGPLITPAGNLAAVNFVDTLQEVIAHDRAVNRKTPKKIITDLLPAMLEITKTNLTERPREFAFSVLQLLAQKDIQLWSRDEEAQAALRRLGWTGQLSNAPGDYLAVITSNVGGGKTDHLVREEIEQEANILSSGIVQKRVRIKRSHQGQRGSQRTGARNVAYLRVYVPLGARLLSAVGNLPPPAPVFETPVSALTPDPDIRATESTLFRDPESGVEVWNEGKKTVFGLWLTVDPGETAEATLDFELQLPRNNRVIPYALLIEKQAGKNSILKSTLRLEDNLRPLTTYGEGTWNPAGWSFAGPLDKNILVSSMLYQL